MIHKEAIVVGIFVDTPMLFHVEVKSPALLYLHIDLDQKMMIEGWVDSTYVLINSWTSTATRMNTNRR